MIRFMAIMIIPTIMSQILLAYLFYDRHWYNVAYYNSNLITNQIKLLIHDIKINTNYADRVAYFLKLKYTFIKEINYFSAPLPKELEILKQTIADSILIPSILTYLPDEKQIVIYFDLDNKILEIRLPKKPIINPTPYIFTLWLIFLTLLLLSISITFSKNQIKSILALTTAADNFGKGLSNDNFKPSGAKEIRQAGNAFLKMRQRIINYISQRTKMLAMISHDLKTPLTRLKLQLELISTKHEEIDSMKNDVDSMTQMINSYLDFARNEWQEESVKINYSNWFIELIKLYWTDLNLIHDIETNLFVSIKTKTLQRAIANILNNASYYSSIIMISIYKQQKLIITDIEDNGVGIKKEERELVFKPFYRSDNARHITNKGNVGLGLTISKEIILGHYGNITLHSSSKLGGLLVRISLPEYEIKDYE